MTDFWNRPLAGLWDALQAVPHGLTSGEARRRLAEFGPNRPIARTQRHAVIQFLGRFRNPLVLLLLAASLISAITGDVTGCAIIASIVLLSVSLDFIQEHQAGRAVEALRNSVAVRASVLRDGAATDLPIEMLVPGDVIALAAGDLIPADARILQARDFFVNQAALTGESYPVEKHAGELTGSAADLTDATNAVFTGGSVISGSAQALVCRTGSATAFGEIAGSLAARRPVTAFQAGIQHFGLLIMRLTVVLVVSVLAINWMFHRPLLESLLFSIALAVGLTPELLPMIVTVTLARGALRMAQKKVIVKQLEAIHNLGSMDVLCTDKTGTLTEATIQLVRHVDVAGNDSQWILELAQLNSRFETGLRSPLDVAVLAHAGMPADSWRKIDELPFDFERRRVSVLVDNGKVRLLIVKGSPEDLLALATTSASTFGQAGNALDHETRARIIALHDALAAEGLRVLGVAFREFPAAHEQVRRDDESALCFAGFVAFQDPPKAGAADALRALQRSGVTVKVITGDHELVARHVCRELALPVAEVLNGQQIADLDDLTLSARAEAVTLFCRATPQHKSRVIRALKQRGHTVGYLGDGINDAPSLHAADIGISVNDAADVAKSAAQLVMLQKDLAVLHDGVMEGRRTFSNVMKYILMGTSSNFGNMFSMAGAALFLPFLPMLPMQILLNNFLYDLSEIAIPLDRVDDQDLRAPRRWNMALVRRFMFMVGPVSSLFDFFTFYLLLSLFHAGEVAFHTGWFMESVATQVLVIFVIRTRGNPLRSGCSPWLAFSSVGVVLAALILPYTALASMLGFAPLPAQFVGALALTVIAYLLAVQAIKRLVLARWMADS